MIVSASPALSEPLRIVALGTSLTAGQIWPQATADRLAACLGSPVEIAVVAQNGATSAWGVANVERVVAQRPDVVLIEFAVNDSAAQRVMSLAASLRNLDAIITALRARAPRTRLVLLRMNPTFGWRALARLRRPTFEAAHRSAALAAGAEAVDLAAAWARVPEPEIRRAMPDGLHPDPAFAARVIAPALATALGGRPC